MAKKSIGDKMTAAKNGEKTCGRPGGKGMINNRPVGKNIMKN